MKKTSKSKSSSRGIHKKMSFSELLEKHPEAAEELFSAGMYCAGCPAASFETIEQGAEMHGFDGDEIVKRINKRINKKSKTKKAKNKSQNKKRKKYR